MTNENMTPAPLPRAPDGMGKLVDDESVIPPDKVRPQNSFNTLLGELPPQPTII